LDAERNRLEIYAQPVNGEYQNVRLVARAIRLPSNSSRKLRLTPLTCSNPGL
jgi:hypothetical protein